MLPLRPALRLSLIAAALVATNLAHAEVPVGAPFTSEQQRSIQQLTASEVRAAVPTIASEVASSVAKTIEGEKQAISNTKEWLEVGRKNIDWWLGFLSLLLAGAAIFVWRTNEKSRQEWSVMQQSITTDHQKNMSEANDARKNLQNDWQTLRTQMQKDHQQGMQDISRVREQLHQEMQVCIKDAKERFDQHLKFTETSVDILKRDLEHARNMLLEIEKHRDSAITPPADAAPEVIEAAQQTNQTNAAHSPQSKLAALAQQFGKEKNWAEASNRWQALTDLEPENHSYWFNFGYSLNEWQSQTKDRSLRHSLASRACKAWQKVTSLEPDNSAAFYNWGNALSDWAKTLTGKAQQQRFAEADQRYAEATRLKPDYAYAFYNWGNGLSDWAKTLEGSAQQQRFAEADQRYAEASRLKPEDADIFYNWGSTLIHWAHTLQGDARATKLAKAEEVLLLAKDKGEKDPYNLACLRAMQQRPDEARVLLEEARAAGFLPDFSHLNTDKDLDRLRELDWFKQLLEEVRQQEEAQVLQPA